MKEDEIIEGNKLIAEFMGLSVVNGNQIVVQSNAFGLETNTLYSVEYHSSWDLLMPVVEKIETTIINKMLPEFFIMFDERAEFKGWFWSISIPKTFFKECLGRESSKIMAMYKATVAYIKWHKLAITTHIQV